MAKCGRCGTRNGVPKDRKIWGYASVCSPCFAFCAMPIEGLAHAVAGLAQGSIRLPLGFTSYHELRGIRAAEAMAKEAEAELLREGERIRVRAEAEDAKAILKRIQARLNRLPRSKRKGLARRIKAVVTGKGGSL